MSANSIAPDERCCDGHCGARKMAIFDALPAIGRRVINECRFTACVCNFSRQIERIGLGAAITQLDVAERTALRHA